MKTILVTGGSGLVGNAIKKICGEYKFDFIFLTSKMCNLLNYPETDLFFNKVRPDFVIHLAANVGGLYKNMDNPVQMLEDNLLINRNVLKCSYKYNVKKLIACLSTCIFPDKTNYPIDETMLHNGPPHPSNEGYAYAKRILDIQCKAYNKEYNTNFVTIIPTNIYGPFDNFNLDESHVLPSLIHKCYMSKNEQTPFVIRGSGNTLRQFIYSIDLAKLIMEILLSDVKEGIILSPEEEYSIKEIAEMISKEFGNTNNLIFDKSFSDGQHKKTVNNSKLMEIFPDFKFTPIDEGLRYTIQWFNENYSSVRK
jgi:GDP-L-fucose synthase